ncbi:MAG: hypothetical protein R3F60_32620 [bacterium]
MGPIRLLFLLCLLPLPALAQAPGGREEICNDGVDNDGDTVTDCGDIDCREAPNCQPDGQPESTNARCQDWVDNDGDGSVDCDDSDCEADDLTACRGSWKGPMETAQAVVAPAGGGQAAAPDEIPALGPGMSVDDLIGTGKDVDGERNDEVCADGIDNDQDGATDCADFGCRFDLSVTVCRGNPGLRFSVVGMITHTYNVETEENDSRLSRLQLRAFGPIPGIQDSFFLVSMLTERTPRLTFAMFQVPLGNTRHRVNVNSGTAGLSQVNAISIHKQLFIERPNLFRAMEQFNSAAIEFEGPLTADGRLSYRAFAAGGSGRFDGNVGGRNLVDDNANYPWGVGASFQFNAVGYYSRQDTPFLYVPVPLTLGLVLGGKYDEREQERFISLNGHLALRYNRLIVLLEDYFKREFEFVSDTNAFVAQVGFLAIPKFMMVAVEYGAVSAGEFEEPPAVLTTTLRSQRDENQFRAAAHFFVYRNIGVLSAVYADHRIPEQDGASEVVEREARLVAQYRF